MSEDNQNNIDDLSAHDLLQRIKNDLIDPTILSKQQRQLCVEVLLFEGYQTSAIAHIMQKTDRTIRRDVEEVRRKNAISPSIDLAKELIGELLQTARKQQAYLTRLSRSQDASTAEKAQSTFLAWRIQKEVAEKLQTLGVLPLKPTEFIGTFRHNLKDDERSVEDMRKALTELEEICLEEEAMDEQVKKHIEDLRKRIDCVDITQDICNLKENIEGGNHE